MSAAFDGTEQLHLLVEKEGTEITLMWQKGTDGQYMRKTFWTNARSTTYERTGLPAPGDWHELSGEDHYPIPLAHLIDVIVYKSQ